MKIFFKVFCVVGIALFGGIFSVSAQSATTVLYSDDFESAQANWLNVSVDDNKNWTRDSGGTPSNSTGPSSGAASSAYYMYLETSSGSANSAGDTAILQGPVVTGSDIHLAFQYHMYGSDTGTLSVDVLSEGSWINDVWVISGQQQASNAAAYTAADVDLSLYTVSQIRFRATAIGGFYGDIAIDNINIIRLVTGPVPPTFNSDPLVKTAAVQYHPYSDNLAADATDANGDALVFAKVSGPAWMTVSPAGELRGTPLFSDIGINSFVVSVSDGVFTGNTNVTLNVQEVPAPEVLFTDNFEQSQGNWVNVTTGDNNDWTRNSNGTSSNNTGPATGAAGSAFYMYLEASSGGAFRAGDSAILLGPDFAGMSIAGTGTHITFKYHMYGTDIGELALDVFSAGAWINNIWSISAQQQTSSSAEYASVDVDVSSYSASQLRFRATAVGGHRGDIAIDDIQIVSHVNPEDFDNDGVLNSSDAFPLDPAEWLDTDADGIGNNADTDDDNDGVPDVADTFPLDANESLDTDGDLIGNNADTDDDNDGVLDIADAFPLDANESLDTDGDLIGNNADTDDDNDGVLDVADAFPLDASESVDTDGDLVGDNADAYQNDSNCSVLSEGNGLSCYVSLLGSATISDILVDSNDIVYLYVAEWSRVLRYNLLTQQYLLSISVGQLNAPDKIIYSANHHRIYMGYSDGQITYIDLAGELLENNFAQLPLSVNGLVSVGRYVLAQDASGAWNTHYIYDQNGLLTDSAEWNYFSRVYEWNEFNSRVYFFRDGTSPNDLHYEEINQLTGLIMASGETPYHGAYQITPPIRVADDGSKLLLGSGDIYDAIDLTLLGSVGDSVIDARWLANGELLTAKTISTQSVIKRREPTLNTVVEQVTFDGAVLGIYDFGTGQVVITQTTSGLRFNAYQPSDDSDGDGVLNLLDAFPLDAAASVDSDNDGYPDSWNTGYSEIDSTTGLALDAYPEDSACYLLQHGDGVQCDYTSTMPLFSPDETQVDVDGTVYLLSTENNRIFRWSSVMSAFTNPLYIGSNDILGSKSPTKMTYSEAHQRIYLGYSSGEITFIDLSTSVEQAFISLPSSVAGLVSVGNFVLAQDASGAWNTHYVFDANGVLTDSADWNYYSRVYAWNAVNNRVYFFRDSQSPNDLHYEEIDQLTGLISASGETPYHGDYQITPPINISLDGMTVLLGSGDLYDANTLTWTGALGTNVIDAVWQAGGGLILIKESLNQTLLERRDASLNTVVESIRFAGQPIAIYMRNNEYIVVSEDVTGILFNTYQSSDDSDNDGVANSQDAFPLDPAASVDTDNDGYPDSWNTGYTSADSTTGLIIDSYPQDSACYLFEHGDGALCDYTATMPVFTPDVVEIDETGTVYLLSTANKRIFRWSASTKRFINPLYVGSTNTLTAESPTKMTYSAAHQRLYLAYSNGSITYVDLAGSLVEQSFANISLAVNGLVSVGNFVLAQDASGAWNTHYIFDVNGVLTDSAEWNRFSRVYAWNAVNNRVYFFRDGTSPNDLHYEEIDQLSGLISGAGETPYHGTYSMIAPIVISQNGSNVMLGSGDVFDASSLSWTSNSGNSFIDAVWFNDVLVMANTATGIELKDGMDFSILTQYAVTGTTHSLVAYGEDVIRVYSDTNGVGLTIEPIGDHDGDGLPAWWELSYGLDDSDPADAVLDIDGDGLTNSVEYINLSSPVSIDTDGDGITDGDEVNMYFTKPNLADTDSDGLSDGYEILISFTSPLLVDTDADGFSDGEEVNVYATDPTDPTSIPMAITSYNESFESTVMPAGWTETALSNASWIIDSTQASVGVSSLRSGVIANNGQSAVQYSALFAAGTLSFSTKVDAEACCDKLNVYVDGVLVHTISTNTLWTNYQVVLTSGKHTLEWRYYKDSSVSSGSDSAWIDDVAFQAN